MFWPRFNGSTNVDVTYRADVGESERATGELGRRELGGECHALESIELDGQLEDALVLHIAEVGHYETVVGVYGHADVVSSLYAGYSFEALTSVRLVNDKAHLVDDIFALFVDMRVQDGERMESERACLARNALSQHIRQFQLVLLVKSSHDLSVD